MPDPNPRPSRQARSVPLWPFAPYALLVLIHLSGHAAGNAELAGWTQQWLMFALLLGFLLAAPSAAWPALLAGSLALLGSSLGDNSDVGGGQLLRGLAAFAAAHVAYIVLFAWGLGLRPRQARKWSMAYAALLVAVLAVVLPHAGPMSAAVLLYALLILVMAVLASAGNRAMALGAFLFVLSDALLSLKLFVPDFGFWMIDLLIMFCYAAGQGLIMLGAVAALRHGLAGAEPPESGKKPDLRAAKGPEFT